MNTVAVCTSIYEAARPFLPAYLDGIRAFSESLGHPVDLVLANDGFLAAEQAFGGTPGAVHIVDARADGIGAVRRKMIEAAASSDVIVFCDFDDALLAGAVRHLSTLESADISFGDLQIIDVAGNVVAPNFFKGTHVPSRISSPDALVDRNFLGFSNTAIRRASIRPAAMNIPDKQVAADWWFFTMLLESGAHARRCQRTVAQYRQHGSNTLGGRPSSTPAAVLARCQLFLAHQTALPSSDARTAAALRVGRLADAISASPSHWAPILDRVCGQPGVWFDDLNAAASFL